MHEAEVYIVRVYRRDARRSIRHGREHPQRTATSFRSTKDLVDLILQASSDDTGRSPTKVALTRSLALREASFGLLVEGRRSDEHSDVSTVLLRIRARSGWFSPPFEGKTGRGMGSTLAAPPRGDRHVACSIFQRRSDDEANDCRDCCCKSAWSWPSKLQAGPAEEVAQIAGPRVQALEDGNIDAYVTAYADNAVFQSSLSPFRIEGKEAIRAYFNQLVQLYPKRRIMPRQTDRCELTTTTWWSRTDMRCCISPTRRGRSPRSSLAPA